MMDWEGLIRKVFKHDFVKMSFRVSYSPKSLLSHSSLHSKQISANAAKLKYEDEEKEREALEMKMRTIEAEVMGQKMEIVRDVFCEGMYSNANLTEEKEAKLQVDDNISSDQFSVTPMKPGYENSLNLPVIADPTDDCEMDIHEEKESTIHEFLEPEIIKKLGTNPI
jgi:hypothetical protein